MFWRIPVSQAFRFNCLQLPVMGFATLKMYVLNIHKIYSNLQFFTTSLQNAKFI